MPGAGQAERRGTEEVPGMGKKQAWEVTAVEQAAQVGSLIQYCHILPLFY